MFTKCQQVFTFNSFGTSEFENFCEISFDQKSYLEPNIERFEVQWFFVFKKVEKVLVELFHERVNQWNLRLWKNCKLLSGSIFYELFKSKKRWPKWALFF